MTTSLPARIFGLAIVIVAAAALGAFAQSRSHESHDTPLLSSTDVAFAQMMMVHHHQALTLCDLLTPQAAPEIRTLAEQIRLQQQGEIGTMIGWLQLADEPLNPPVSSTPAAGHMSSHHDAGGHPASSMGMASSEELTRLKRSTGSDNEALFLQLMTRHHQGGAEMAFNEARDGSNDVVKRTARAMATEQLQEIQLMQELMKPRGAAPLPYP